MYRYFIDFLLLRNKLITEDFKHGRLFLVVDTKSQINELKSELRKKEDGSSQTSRDIESLQNNVSTSMLMWIAC